MGRTMLPSIYKMTSTRSTQSTRQRKEPLTRPAKLKARKQQFMREEIWDAAIDLFAENGFEQTTVDDIAEAAGVSRRSFFRYFSSKSDLMAHGLVGYEIALTDAILACPPAWSLAEVFRTTVLQVARGLTTETRTRKIMDIVVSQPAAREAQLSSLVRVQDQIAAAFAQRTKRDKRRRSQYDLNANLAAALTICSLGVTFHAWFADCPEDVSATVTQVLATLRKFVENCDGRPE
jgi:AcrR family transcriptional regulator